LCQKGDSKDREEGKEVRGLTFAKEGGKTEQVAGTEIKGKGRKITVSPNNEVKKKKEEGGVNYITCKKGR